MKVLLFSAFVAWGAMAMPDHHFLRGGHVRSLSSKLNADCTCIDGTVLADDGAGNALAGEYRYKDPLGNTITVKYSYDKSGGGYSEKRRIDTTSSLLATTSAALPAPLPEEVAVNVDQVAAKVTRQVRDLLPVIIREAVAASDGEDRSRMIARVRTKVRSVILTSLRDAMGGDTGVDLEDITDLIMESLNDSFVATIEKETEVTTLVTSEITGADVDQDSLVETILNELKGLVVETVGTNEKDVSIPTPVVTQVVTQVEKQVEHQHHSAQDRNLIVIQILEELRPIIIQLIEDQTRIQQQSAISEQVPYPVATADELDNAAEVELHRAGLALVQSDSFTETILSRIGPAVDVELRSTFEQYSSQLRDEEIVEKVITLLRTVIEQEIRVQMQLQDVQLAESFFASADYSALLAKMSTELRVTIRNALASLRSEFERSSETLISEVAREIKATIRAVARSEAESASSSSVEIVVGSILEDIRPSVRQTVRTMISTRFEIFNADDSSFVERITGRVIQQITEYTREQVQYFMEQSKIPAQPAKPVVLNKSPTVGSGSLQSIFGISGANNVKVETPGYRYAYLTGKEAGQK